MGLQGQLSDVSSDSIPLLLLCLIATGFNHLRSSLSALLHFLGLPRLHGSPDHPVVDAAVLTSLGSGLAGHIVLAEQLNLNRILSHRFDASAARERPGRCVVCLCPLRDGDHVRELDCRHVFHKTCLDGWLDCRNFSCPLCRSPLVPEGRVECTGRRVGAELVEWFSLR